MNTTEPVRAGVLIHYVVMDSDEAPNPALEGVGKRLGAVLPASIRAGRQHYACEGKTELMASKHAGRLFEGALHQATGDAQYVTCPLCQESKEYRDAIADHEKHTSRDQGIFGDILRKQRASQSGGEERTVARSPLADANPEDSLAEPTLPVGAEDQ